MRHRILSAGLLLAAIGLLLLGGKDPGDHRLICGRWSMTVAFLALALMVAAGLAAARAVSRSAFMKLLLATGSLALCWIVLEAAALAGWIRFDRLLGNDPTLSVLGTLPQPGIVQTGTAHQDTATPWGLASEPIHYEYRTNALGFRNLPDRAEAEIILLGDSILVGALLPFEDTLAAQLERALGRTTMNVALIGLSPADEHRLFRETGLDPRGRTVVQFLFEDNDLHDTRQDRVPDGAEQEWHPGRSLTVNFGLLLQRLTQPAAGIARRRVGTIGEQDYTFLWARESMVGFDAEADEILAAVGGFAGEMTAAGGQFALVFVPSKLRVLGPLAQFPAGSDLRDVAAHLSPLRETAAAWAAEHGIAFLDLTAPLEQAARTGPIPWFWGDTHPNAAGHAAMARALADWSFLRR